MEVLGRITLEEDETISDLFVTQLYQEENGDEIDALSPVRTQQQHRESSMSESMGRRERAAQHRSTATQRMVNKENRKQKRRQTAIVDDDSSDNNYDQEESSAKIKIDSIVSNKYSS